MSDLLLFVYGSLRRDANERHHPLLRGARYVGSATVRGKLYRVSWHPGLHGDEHGGSVYGEVFAIPEAVRSEMLRALDAYEGANFRLDEIVARGPGDVPIAAHTYTWLGNGAQATFLPDGDFGVPPLHPTAD